MKLYDKTIKGAEPRKKPYKLFDGGGLFLEIMPNGSKLWRLKYRYLGKEKRISFGAYPLVSLADAREKRDEAKKFLLQHIDPSTARQDNREALIRNAQNTFEATAREWHENQKGRWSENHYNNVMHRMERDIFPYIGKKPIKNIDAPTLLDVLRRIEKRGALDIASRARQICGQVFRYGIITGRCSRDPSVDLRGALKTRKTTHFAALQPKEIPELLQALERNDARLYARTRRAIKLSMLTFLRPGELRKARWEEIDFEERVWTIPGERMKMGREHIVPLSRQAIALFKEQQEETGIINTPWVFPSLIKPRQPISDGTVNVAVKKLGFKGRMTAHGFRALARTTIREKLDYAPDVIECQLAHKAAGPLGEAYRQAVFLTGCFGALHSASYRWTTWSQISCSAAFWLVSRSWVATGEAAQADSPSIVKSKINFFMATIPFSLKKKPPKAVLLLVTGDFQAADTRPRRPLGRSLGHTPPLPGHNREAT